VYPTRPAREELPNASRLFYGLNEQAMDSTLLKVSRSQAAATAAALAFLLLAACGQRQANPSRVYRMGESIKLGPLIYNVLDAQWKTELGEGTQLRSPNKRFLLIQLTVTNSGGAETFAPPLKLEDAQGSTFFETPGGEGVPNWLGFLRKLAPAQTDQGRVLFDVPTGAYRLRVTDDSTDPAQEKSALIDIPLRLEHEPPPQILKEIPDADAPPKR
jgi:hypothetical protein